MNEGTHAVLLIDDKEYELSHFKVTPDEDNYFLADLEMVICDGKKPELNDESYVAKLKVNGDAIWYFPWVWMKDAELPNLKASVHGAIFCPFGLSEEEEAKYDALNLIITSDVCYTMTAEVWKGLLFIFGDWLKAKSIPQHKEYSSLAADIEIPDEESLESEDEEDEELEEDEHKNLLDDDEESDSSSDSSSGSEDEEET